MIKSREPKFIDVSKINIDKLYKIKELAQILGIDKNIIYTRISRKNITIYSPKNKTKYNPNLILGKDFIISQEKINNFIKNKTKNILLSMSFEKDKIYNVTDFCKEFNIFRKSLVDYIEKKGGSFIWKNNKRFAFYGYEILRNTNKDENILCREHPQICPNYFEGTCFLYDNDDEDDCNSIHLKQYLKKSKSKEACCQSHKRKP